MSYTKIVQIGAGGHLGKPTLDKLVESGKFEITVLARENSSYTSPHSSVKLQKLDIYSHSALVSALQGVEAVVLTFGDFANVETNSRPIIDAAIEAGVKRIIPAEFGNDIFNAPGREQLVFSPKLNVAKYLREKAELGTIEYTGVANGPFFDWSLTHFQFIGFDIPNRKVTLFDDGNPKFNATNLDSVAQAIVGILSNPAATKNRQVRVHDFETTQNEILQELESLVGAKFTIEPRDTAKLEAETSAGLARGEFTPQNISGLLQAYIFGENSSARWGTDDDSELLGLQKKNFRDEIKKVL